MSGRDTPAYDANLLAQAPVPTKEQRQGGYQTKGLLDDPRGSTPLRSPAPAPPLAEPSSSNGRTVDLLEKGSIEDSRPVAAAATPTKSRPWYRNPRWLIALGVVLAAIIIAAVVGGVVGSKNSHPSSSSSSASASASSPTGASATVGVASVSGGQTATGAANSDKIGSSSSFSSPTGSAGEGGTGPSPTAASQNAASASPAAATGGTVGQSPPK